MKKVSYKTGKKDTTPEEGTATLPPEPDSEIEVFIALTESLKPYRGQFALLWDEDFIFSLAEEVSQLHRSILK